MSKSVRLRILRWLYRHRGLCVAPPMVYVLFSTRWEIEDEWLIWMPAATFVLLGVLSRVWAQQHIRFRLNEKRHLATTGPYSFIRHPLYVANTLICLGMTFASELLWMAPVTLLWCAVLYATVARYEEQRMLRKYGAVYGEYMERVPRWVPRLQNIGQAQFVNRHFWPSLLVEATCLLALFPYVLKEITDHWLEG